MKPNSQPPSSGASIFDRVRAWTLGLASEREAADLRRELERDGEAASFADDYREIHEATRVLHDEAPQSRLELAALEACIDAEQRERFRRRWRRVAAAAVVVVLGGAAWWVLARGASSNAPLRLSAISLAASKDGGPRDEFPPLLASYEPVADGEIRWIDDLASGESVARASGRPVLLFGMFPTCPWCRQMKAEGLRDPTVIAMVEDFVPVQVNLQALGEEERNELLGHGYPLFEVRDDAGDVVHAFPGFHDAPSFVDNLATAAEKSSEPGELPAWSDVQRRARAYGEALLAEDAGRLAEAERGFASIEHDGSSGALGRAAQHGLERIADAARATLLAARSVAMHDARAAERDLADAKRRFEGTPYAADLEAARERLARDGRFPALATGE